MEENHILNTEMDSRINLEEKGDFLYHFINKLENNPYYNQKWVWCNRCGKKHNMNSNIASDHRVKPIPLECNDLLDHCWKYTGVSKFGYLDINVGTVKNKYILYWLRECGVYECIICGKRRLDQGTNCVPVDSLEKDLRINEEWEKGEINKLIEFGNKLKEKGESLLKEYGLQFGNSEKSYHADNLNNILREIQNIKDYSIEKITNER